MGRAKNPRLKYARMFNTRDANRLVGWIKTCLTSEAKWDARGREIPAGSPLRHVGVLPSYWPHYMDVLTRCVKDAVRAARRLREIEGGPEL